MKQSLLVIFTILVSIAMFGCNTTGRCDDGVHWSASLSGGVYDGRDGDLGFVLMGSVSLYDKYPANMTMPIIVNQTKVKVTNTASQDQSQSQNNNGSNSNGGGNNGGGGGDGDGDDCKGKGHENHDHNGKGKGHECDPD